MPILPPASSPSAPNTVLEGGGEMGALMRTLDWSQTPVGPVETWPQSLRTVISIVLASRHAMIAFWGPELVQFYNDSYRPMLGAAKHPRAMGQSAQECWAEAWEVLEPSFSAVTKRGESTFIEDGLVCMDRNGYLEEAYFTYAYSPIKDESGGINGLFNACSESTERVLSARRFKTLHALSGGQQMPHNAEEACQQAARVLDANRHDVPFALIYLADPEHSTLRLTGTVGLEPGSAAAPPTLDLDAPAEVYPWAGVVRTGTPVFLKALPAALPPFPGGPWPEPATSAMALPLVRPGHDAPTGVLVVGISPRRALDAQYQGFLELLARHVSNAVANARAHEEEKRRLEALAGLNRAKTDFFANVSHEFRTPLTLMLGPLEDSLADTAQPLPPRQRERQETIHRSSLRLLKLVNTLLDFARVEAGRARAIFRPVDLSALTAELASAFRSLIESAGMRLVVDCPPLPEPVYVDAEAWEKVVLNLLSNAFKFTFDGEIRVSLRLQGKHVQVQVADTGAGIPSQALPHLFERFHRVQGAKGRSYEGSGIGLALVKELIQQHGGTVEVQSAVDQGTTFTIALPLGSAHLPSEYLQAAAPPPDVRQRARFFLEEASQWLQGEGAPEPLPTPEPGAPEETPRSSARILLVEDNADMRAYIQKLLGARWTVEAVADGMDALRAAREQTPDLILSDVMMPGLGGFGLLKELRADPRTAAVPVILLSARAGEEASIEGLQAGADDYLVKPFSARELVSRVAARLEISQAHRALRMAQVRLHTQLMQAPVAVSIVSGPELRFELANTRYLALLGRQDVLGKPFQEVFPELPGDAPVFQMVWNVFRTGQPFTADEYPVHLDPDGTGGKDEYFQFTCQPIRDATGTIEGVMTVAVDVTFQVEARAQLQRLAAQEREARGRAEDADQRKDEFLAMLAHELRNPLAALSTALEMMGRSPGDEVRAARLRDTCNRQVHNLVRLVDDLLDVSRITRGKVELRPAEVDFTTIVQNALGTSRTLIDARGHELSVTFAPGNFHLQADATRLEQVVSNLLNNAAKYTEPGGSIQVRLEREETPTQAWAVLRVRDTGRGIAPEMLSRVFDLFVQVDPSIDRSGGGLGIGLTLVDRLVAMHGGTVSVHSEGLGKGSEFRVRLPLPPRQDAAPRAPPPGARRSPENPSKRRVVVVEDNEDVRDIMKELLEDQGHEVEVATHGLAAVETLLAVLPDVAFVDVGLPGIDGFEVARRVRATPEGASLFLVALTGYGGPEAKAKAQQAGFNLHLVKPINFQDLPRIMESTHKKTPEQS
ncbi:Signal transduction histidine kinase [Stigmatella aurantiaca]|uniref:histidine kinase n=1 Tax=Stigmatella aurantiaca TaxID=41 RepID=A0A1H7ZMN6_STIAU|nr:ATP-binding protein [Stigmatella aurantiaca]SEM59543.1 Signal transduction histidine kinase [Stigmatella aurantiaca]